MLDAGGVAADVVEPLHELPYDLHQLVEFLTGLRFLCSKRQRLLTHPTVGIGRVCSIFFVFGGNIF